MERMNIFRLCYALKLVISQCRASFIPGVGCGVAQEIRTSLVKTNMNGEISRLVPHLNVACGQERGSKGDNFALAMSLYSHEQVHVN